MPSTAVAPTTAGVKVGDFFASSWGYDQTNVDFYKVVGLTPKGVKVQKWTQKCVQDSGPSTYVVPGDGPATVGSWVDGEYVTGPAPVKTKRLSPGWREGQVYFTVSSYASAYQWDGTPEYQTGSGYGH